MAEARTTFPTLPDRLRARIRSSGPIPFVEFMEAALYDPEGGFFQRHAVGERGDFVTAPHLSPAFGVLVSRQLDEIWDLLGRPAPFVVVEAGAGDGTLARQVLEFLSPPARRALEYVAVERGAAGREALDGLEVTVARSLDDVAPREAGCLVANELLDNLPFRWLRGTREGVVEVHVGLAANEFSLVSGPLLNAGSPWLTDELRVGEGRLVQQGAMELVQQSAHLFDRGYLWLADYGFADGPHPEAPHAYRGQRLEEDVLSEPGSRDITAGVDFDAIARTARDEGLTTWGPVSQRDALMALGFRELDQEARRRQVEATAEGRGLDAARIFSARQRASLLVEPSGLGDFLVLAAGRGVEVPPTSIRQVG